MAQESYKYNVTWVYSLDEDPERRYTEFGIQAVSVQRAIARVLGDLNENGYDRRAIRVIDVQNMDIT
jgi:hypothetical protein